MQSIPIILIVFVIFKCSVEIPIEYPNSENCVRTGEIRRKGRNYHHSIKPLRYQCLECNKRFYAHTSIYFKEFNQSIQEKISYRIAKCGSKVDEISKEFNISNSSASKLAERYRKHLQSNISKSRSFRINNYRRLGIRGRTVFIDETFRKINGRQYIF